MFNILIVDDAVDTRKILSKELLVIADDCMPKIFTAENGSRALEIFNTETIDVVITDIRMPVMDGVMLTSKLREASETVTIVLITAYQDFESVKNAISYNISNLLCKPINYDFIEQLKSIIYDAFKKKQVLYKNKLYSPNYNLRMEVKNAIEQRDNEKIISLMDSLVSVYNETANIQQLIEQCVSVLRGIYDYYASYTTSMPYSENDFKQDINEMYRLGNGKDIIEFIKKQITEAGEPINTVSGKNDEKIYKIKQYIEENFKDKELYVGMLSQKFNVSRTYMCVLFKKHYNMSITAYITSLRVEEAKKLLCKTNLSITKISGMLGYSVRRYFIDAFKNICGISPSEYREKHSINGEE